jgi:hypothetical protein
MHSALALPEIVELIIQTGLGSQSDHHFLQTCRTINKIFFNEINRIVWNTVGESIGISPPISKLAKLVRKSPQRAQVYANFVHFLRFGYEIGQDDSGASTRLIETIRWHPELMKLEYPELRHICFFGRLKEDPGFKWDIGLAALHYAKPSVTNFDVAVMNGFSDVYLDDLASSCPSLTNLNLSSAGSNTVTGNGLSRFLHHVPNLRFVYVKEAFENAWTPESLTLFAKLQKLKIVYLGTMPDSCFTSLPNIDGQTFPALERIHVGLSDLGLDRLAPYAIKLTELHLENTTLPPSEHVLASASKLVNLKRLFIDFTKGSVIDGNDILLLARSCAKLEVLYISDIQRRIRGAAPEVVNLDDDTVLELSGSLESLRSFNLVIGEPRLLTYKSVKYLSLNCPLLDSLLLSCDFDWWEAVDSTRTMTSDLQIKPWSTTISDLHFVLPRKRDYQIEGDELIIDPAHNRLEQPVTGMVKMFPELKTIEIMYGSNDDYEIANQVQRIVDPMENDWGDEYCDENQNEDENEVDDEGEGESESESDNDGDRSDATETRQL